VRWLVDKGVAIHERDSIGNDAMLYASLHGHAPVVRLLVERGGDPTTAREDGLTYLMMASLHGHLELPRALPPGSPRRQGDHQPLR
jgi:uncharacterized protein